MAIEHVFRESVEEFIAHEFTLVRKNAHEQSFCDRLAIYMDHAKERHKLRRYYVDVEYNRQGNDKKAVRHPIKGRLTDVCDLLLHSCGELQADNLIAVEMKKNEASNARKRNDRERLQALTSKLYWPLVKYQKLKS